MKQSVSFSSATSWLNSWSPDAFNVPADVKGFLLVQNICWRVFCTCMSVCEGLKRSKIIEVKFSYDFQKKKKLFCIFNISLVKYCDGFLNWPPVTDYCSIIPMIHMALLLLRSESLRWNFTVHFEFKTMLHCFAANCDQLPQPQQKWPLCVYILPCCLGQWLNSTEVPNCHVNSLSH